jgi:hypothetical protein
LNKKTSFAAIFFTGLCRTVLKINLNNFKAASIKPTKYKFGLKVGSLEILKLNRSKTI